MKKLLLISLSVLILPACADKNQYEQAVLEQMQKEADIKDYKITPEYMTKCVVDTTSQNMPGIFAFDPKRLMAYRNYTKMLNLTKSADPKKTLEELRTDFGSAKDLAEAHTNYTESLMECYSAVISESEEAAKEKK
jgi:negative regulator of sigma E activity